MTRARAFVIGVSGTSGSGKSTLVRGLAAGLAAAGNAAVGSVFFDDYAAVSDLPENDLVGWLARGGDPDEWRTDRLAADVFALRAGESISTLDGASTIGPLDVVVLEEPFGRSRTAIGPMVDLALHIRLPLHIALARRVLRDFIPADGEVPADAADRLRGYLALYVEVGGAFYEVADRLAQESSDVVLDGLAGSDELLGAALTEVAAVRNSSR